MSMFAQILICSILCLVGVAALSIAEYKNPNAQLGGSKLKGAYSCDSNNYKLLSVLNFLCNATQNTSVTARDACYGCFFRAGALPGGSTQLTSLSQCATTYLTGTTYAACATNLATLSSGARPTTAPTFGYCYTGYCEFVRCVRKVNSDNLVDGCFLANNVNRNFLVRADRVAFYTNVTSCILARARCGQFNPITGELQSIQGAYNTNYGGGKYANYRIANSLQITPGGDIRVVAFPGTLKVGNYFCSSQTITDQSTFAEAVC